MHAADRTPRIPIFVTVLTLFVLAALLLGTALTVTNYLETRRAAIRAASDSFKTTIDRINERRLGFFAPAFLIAAQLSDAPAVRQIAGLKASIEPLILTSLALSPQISSAYVGYENGDYFQVLSISEAESSFVTALSAPPTTRFAIQEISHDEAGLRTETWRFLDAGRRQVGTRNIAADYDPRLRPWYRDARAQPQNTVRNVPYIFATTSQAGMTLAKAFEGGAVGVDITIDRLMAYVRSVRLNDSHRFVAFDEQNRLLAHSDPSQMFKPSGVNGGDAMQVATVGELSDPVIQEAVRLFERNGPFPLVRFHAAGADFLATVVRQVARDGGVFFVLYAAPLSDFMGTLADAAARSIPPALLIFLLSLPAIAYLAHSISRPVMKLAGEADLIRAFKLDDPIGFGSRVRELDVLIRSMSGMKSTLREVTKFVPKALVRDILQSETVVAVGGETRNVSIMFTDVQDFTSMAGVTPAKDLMVNLSTYFEELASVVVSEQGTVDKFIGDAIFSFWNAPLPVAHHEHVACRTALKCRAAAHRLGERWKADGLAPWHTRFGLHGGEAILGNVGSTDRIDYTAIGDTVNVASRIEGLNKYYGTEILASAEIADLCSDAFLFRRVDRIQPKGAKTSLDLFELLGALEGPEDCRATTDMTDIVRDWHRVYEAYASRDWMRAFEALEAFARARPDDMLAGIYLDRVVGFLLEPPPDDWDGTIRFTRK
ncbi:adenylate/guanylate cyclase domain-containing protein [Bradyrhizobium sp. CIAT3101]|uniref:adenylate/guanylate cyclase domain-containing protein n=1 Tax=Bradyrhizobium sp. CIAT3101 TaxID=439387 RepID=UPI0024B04082|nr:adenylate/guanylate cyclase domain-containing protein [Bradyrhizobium sp. CIAT3101]WFU77727.1 adenylate/guanylate cyclase domain-containing protein [Bradyrhizobium sp. CIAT3101]